MSSQSGERIEAIVCDVGDLKDGEMRDVAVGEGKALLVRTEGQYYAVGAKCTHYGAPLSKGALCNDRVRCPWHGACFNVKTGDIEEYPGLDSLQKFEVKISDGKVKVIADKASLATHKRVKSMCRASASDSKMVLIIGGGPASVACAETLRQNGFQGKITLATKENCLPYDRIKLSKTMTTTAEAIALRPKDFYESYDIDVKTDKEAVSVDTSSKTVKFNDGSSLAYASLVLATGGRPRTLPIPGNDLKNVCILRSPNDANYIVSEANGKNVVVIGSSFIGLEVAAALHNKANSVTVIVRGEMCLSVCGAQIGKIFQKMHEDKGVKFEFKTGLSEIVGENGHVKGVVLSSGKRLPAELVVLGVGVAPATEFVKDSDLNMTKQGFIQVDKSMKTNLPDIYAAGDIVEFPLFMVNDDRVSIGHWQMAHHHGRIVGKSILGIKAEELHSVPYFWTMQYGKSVRYTGYGAGFDDIIIHGSTDELKFVAYYTKGEKVVAAASMGYDPIISEVAEILNTGKEIKKDEIRNDPRGWSSNK